MCLFSYQNYVILLLFIMIIKSFTFVHNCTDLKFKQSIFRMHMYIYIYILRKGEDMLVVKSKESRRLKT